MDRAIPYTTAKIPRDRAELGYGYGILDINKLINIDKGTIN